MTQGKALALGYHQSVSAHLCEPRGSPVSDTGHDKNTRVPDLILPTCPLLSGHTDQPISTLSNSKSPACAPLLLSAESPYGLNRVTRSSPQMENSLWGSFCSTWVSSAGQRAGHARLQRAQAKTPFLWLRKLYLPTNRFFPARSNSSSGKELMVPSAGMTAGVAAVVGGLVEAGGLEVSSS